MTAAVPVLINASGGAARGLGERCAGEVEGAFAAAGLKVEVRMLPGDQVCAAVAALKDRELVVVGGGDGTLGGAAGELVGGRAALGILPLGTRNHLARDLGVPMTLGAAAKLIAERPLRRIDLARVNGHAFVNNASIGLYPALVEERERHAMPKWLATLPATLAVIRRLRHHRLRLTVDGQDRPVLTPLLFVGNNHYALDAGRIGRRTILDAGLLSIVAVAPQRRWGLAGFVVRTLIGRADRARDFAAMDDAAAFTVAAHARHIRVALDGEVMRLALPLQFAIEPKALTVVAPLEGPAATA